MKFKQGLRLERTTLSPRTAYWLLHHTHSFPIVSRGSSSFFLSPPIFFTFFLPYMTSCGAHNHNHHHPLLPTARPETKLNVHHHISAGVESALFGNLVSWLAGSMRPPPAPPCGVESMMFITTSACAQRAGM